MIDMASEVAEEPDRAGLVIYVGQDGAGHWLVQDSRKRIEGRFVSEGAAMGYAKAEGQVYHAAVEIASITLVPLVPFVPVAKHERALQRAA